MNMHPSAKAYAIIKNWEKFRPTAYRPTKRDRWTIGWGHTAGVYEGMTCTTAQAEIWLVQDTETAVECINRVVKVALTQNQFDALVSLVFNIGVTNFSSSHLLTHLNAGDYAGAADRFLKWDYSKGTELDGLENRRKQERDVFLSKGA